MPQPRLSSFSERMYRLGLSTFTALFLDLILSKYFSHMGTFSLLSLSHFGSWKDYPGASLIYQRKPAET